MEIIYTVDRKFYVIPAASRECSFWLSVESYPLPVPIEWHRPGLTFACVFPRRDHYRIGSGGPGRPGSTEQIQDDSQLVADYREAVWWTLGLEEAWAELDGMRIAMCEAQRQIEELTGPGKKEKGRG